MFRNTTTVSQTQRMDLFSMSIEKNKSLGLVYLFQNEMNTVLCSGICDGFLWGHGFYAFDFRCCFCEKFPFPLEPDSRIMLNLTPAVRYDRVNKTPQRTYNNSNWLRFLQFHCRKKDYVEEKVHRLYPQHVFVVGVMVQLSKFTICMNCLGSWRVSDWYLSRVFLMNHLLSQKFNETWWKSALPTISSENIFVIVKNSCAKDCVTSFGKTWWHQTPQLSLTHNPSVYFPTLQDRKTCVLLVFMSTKRLATFRTS